MSKVNMYFATGFEEVEALTVVDLLRRVKIEVDMVSITGIKEVKGAHGITVKMDKVFDKADDDVDMLILPGGMPGTTNLAAHLGLETMIKTYNNRGKYIAAICAAPTVFGKMGLLKGKYATCYPGMEDGLEGAIVKYDPVVIDENIITSRGLGTAIDFALAIICELIDEETANDLAKKVVYNI